MKAVCWYGKNDVRTEIVPDPMILNPRDIIVKVTSTAICGSDLHLYDGYIPTMEKGDILGHEFMGTVVETGGAVTNLRIGDRVIIPFPIACGKCYFCRNQMTSLCDNSNPNSWLAAKAYGYSGSGIFGYSHLLGGYAGGQAEYVRVPYGDFGAFKVSSDLEDDKLLFLTDIFPTGFMAAENCEIKKGDIVAVWGAGPVGQFAIESAFLLGAEQVIVIDSVEERLNLAKEIGAHVVNFKDFSVKEALEELTGGRGPDACIDAVGLEADCHGIMGKYDKVKQSLKLHTDRVQALREAIYCCRKGGVLSIPGVYGGVADKIPLGSLFGKALRVKSGQTHVHKYLDQLLDFIERGDVNPSRIISHHFSLDEASHAYELFKHKKEGCTKVVLHTH